MDFALHTRESAPEKARETIDAVEKNYGFVPNLISVLARSPAAVDAYVSIGAALKKASLKPVEQQVVFLTVSASNACDYCVAAHSAIAAGAGMPKEVLEAIRNAQEIPDSRLQALATFANAVQEKKGWVSELDLRTFADAGYDEENVLEVITILAMKTLSNYANHVANTPVDDAFAGFKWKSARS